MLLGDSRNPEMRVCQQRESWGKDEASFHIPWLYKPQRKLEKMQL